jgi:hypothetical protein
MQRFEVGEWVRQKAHPERTWQVRENNEDNEWAGKEIECVWTDHETGETEYRLFREAELEGASL